MTQIVPDFQTRRWSTHFEQQKQKEYTRQDGIILFVFATMFAVPTLIQLALYHADKHTIKHTEKSSDTKRMGKKVIRSRSKQKASLSLL